MKESILLGLFRDISAIPHASFNEKALSDWVKAFGEKLGLETKQDVFNNVLLRKPATKGYEKAPVVMLQAHLDMVAEKNNDSEDCREVRCPTTILTDIGSFCIWQ